MKLRRQKRRGPIVPVASIADIAFLLIIFFILTSNFMREKDIKATPARAVDVVNLEQASVSIMSTLAPPQKKAYCRREG